MSQNILFSPTRLGDIDISNRIVMAPMTRSRALPDGTPSPEAVEYYRQRASAGLIITEGTYPSETGKGYCRTPGLVSEQHRAGWQRVVDAVKSRNGALVMQLMHCGRIVSHDNQAENAECVAPSAIPAKGKMYTDTRGMVDFDTPRALLTEEIPKVIEEYRQAAQTAFDIGVDGVELHATSGYLPAQFLSSGSNQRSDQYGGNVSNRIRFVVEALESLIAVRGSGRVGLRICPGNPFNDLHDDNPDETFSELLKAINPMKLAYLHVIRMPSGPVDNLALARRHFTGPLIVNDSYSATEATTTLTTGEAQAVSFGRDFIANPDLVERLQQQRDLSPFDHSTLYTSGATGYTDYPPAP
ncbi:alkene reductase [Aestuariicella hydrocarbonica]|uniref:Alkene reductase n=1 Tax=Pseudomaricurvus hydrocarbonicus TaxID=1470433 RepID=A0A9E5JT50_9GAMM|nr:alkene reductase [Aestuariicella hydrocarbonica]NHO66059.1 alkene reductase [Aestuariicella hydrocarbonica]